jgi:DnaJ-class molecular chaperone
MMKKLDPEKLNALGIIVLFVSFKLALIICSRLPKKDSTPITNHNISLRRNNKTPTTLSRYQNKSRTRNSPINRKMKSERNNKAPTTFFRSQTKSQSVSRPKIVCSRCRGTGVVTCGMCRGRGRIEFLGKSTVCNYCKGRRQIRCDSCGGRGRR